MIQWLDQNKEWLFQGVGVTFVAIILGALRNPIVIYFRKKIIQSSEKKIEEQIQERLKEIIAERSLIDVELNIDREDIDVVSFYCVTFNKNEKRKNPFDRIWIIDHEFKINHDADGFSVEKEEIGNRLKHISFPYKFYMSVPNIPEIKSKYYSRLLEAKHIVTGKGAINKNDQTVWNIWFLLGSQPIHPDVQFAGSINHTLVNQILIRNKVYNNTEMQTI